MPAVTGVQRFKDGLAQGEEGDNYTNLASRRHVQKCYGNTEYLLYPGEWRSRKLSKKSLLFVLGKSCRTVGACQV